MRRCRVAGRRARKKNLERPTQLERGLADRLIMKSLLLVEDDVLVRRGLARVLRRFAFVREAASVAEATELLGQESFDVVLSDRHLGDGDGVDLLRLVAERCPSALRVLMTGSLAPEVAGLGAPHRTLQKPFAAVDLLRAIADGLYD